MSEAAMIDKTELECLLKAWAEEYGGGRYPNVGWADRNLLQTLIDHKGFVPDSRGFARVPIRTKSDQVEQIVRRMEVGDMYRCAKILRADYFLPNAAITDRLSALRKIGVCVSRASYYDFLAQAKAFVRGALCHSEIA